MAMNKKAYFFSITVLVLLGVAMLYFASHRDPGYTKESSLESQRLIEIRSFIKSVEQDASTAAYVAGYRSLLTFHDEINKEEGRYALDFDDLFETLAINGTLHGEDMELLENASISDWQESLEKLAKTLLIELNTTSAQMTATQQDPWHVTVTLKITIDVNDDYTDSKIHTPIEANALIPITNLFDPVYTVGTNQRYVQMIKQHPGSDVDEMLQNRYYIATPKGVSYLDRVKGRFQPSEQGIESLAHVQRLADVSIINEGSIIDWHYLGPSTVPADCQLPGQPPWALIPASRAADYAATCP